MNKTDLRYRKTETAIKQAYFALKKKNSPTVSVKELCDVAMINKTTFYSHYDTMDSLRNAVCTDFIMDLLSQCEKMDVLMSAPRDFIVSIYHLFSGNIMTIEQLYGADFNKLVNDVENMMINHFVPTDMDDETKMTVRFCIGGAFRLLSYEADPARMQKAVELIEKILA
ncbi:MAG: hypothetical protein IKW76_13780 [Clostridia bacterium]|nr:hypothetical protein [Clostridia bacterium]